MIVVSSCIFNLTGLGIFLVLLLYAFNLNCLCANVGYGLLELNKLTYLLTVVLQTTVWTNIHGKSKTSRFHAA